MPTRCGVRLGGGLIVPPLAPDKVRRVLFSNISLDQRSGTEMFLWDLVRPLSRRGIECAVYTPGAGDLAYAFRDYGVPVYTTPSAIEFDPDILHCQHLPVALCLLERFPGVPALFMVHDAKSPFDLALPLPRFARFVAVDEYCRERICVETGLGADDVSLVFNAVDIESFGRRLPLPEHPARAAIYTSHAPHSEHVRLVERVCAHLGIELTRIGHAAGHYTAEPHQLLQQFDLVFGKARCAMEAMAVGAAVILIGPEGVGEYVTPGRVAAMRRRNFGRSLLHLPLTDAALKAQIARYSAPLSTAVCEVIRNCCGTEAMCDAMMDVYRVVASAGAGAGVTESDRSWTIRPGQMAGFLEPLVRENGAFRLAYRDCKWRLELAATEQRESELAERESQVAQREGEVERQAGALAEMRTGLDTREAAIARQEAAQAQRGRTWLEAAAGPLRGLLRRSGGGA